MKRFGEQLKKQADSIKLRATERRDLRDRLVAYMEYHPLPKEQREATASATSVLPAELYKTVRIDFLLFGKFASAFAVLFLIIVPIVAERAVPGDVLYPVKVGFNEEIRSTLTFSPYEKVEWETTRLERRIAEARLLASEGKLTPEVEAGVAEAIKTHSDAAQKEIAVIRETDGEEASLAGITLTSALDVQSEMLESDLDEDIELASTTPGRSLAQAVSDARDSAAVTAEATPVSYERLLARVEMETTRAYEYLDSINNIVSDEERIDIEHRLGTVGEKVTASIEAAEDIDVSIPLLTAVLTDTRKLISFMTNIDVRENVSIDELIPEELTEEERFAAIELRMEEVTEQVILIGVQLEIAPEGVAEKTERGLLDIADLMSQASSSLAVADLDGADIVTLSAFELASDLVIFTAGDEAIEGPGSEQGTTTESVIEESVSTTSAATSTETTELENHNLVL